MRSSTHNCHICLAAGQTAPTTAGKKRKPRKFTALHLPCFEKDVDQFLDHPPGNAESHIPETQRSRRDSGIFITNIETTQKSEYSVDHRHLAVITPVEPADATPDQGNFKRIQADAL